MTPVHCLDDLRLHYQPRVDLRTLKIECVEALVRWMHPTRGLQGPDAFIPAAEKTGDILRIGAWVINRAVQHAAAWRAVRCSTRVAINVSARQIDSATLLPVLRAALARHAVPADAIELEITERAGVADERLAARTMREVRDMGVRLAIDDFGEGYSGIATLRWLPASVIKLDKRLVAGLAQEPARSRALLKALLAFSRSLGASCVAEGIETREQLCTLWELGCDAGQGFLFSEPVEPEHLRPAGMGIGAGRGAQATKGAQCDARSRSPAGALLAAVGSAA